MRSMMIRKRYLLILLLEVIQKLLINLFDLYKENCIKDLDGMFGFAILDEEMDCIIFARDFMVGYLYIIIKEMIRLLSQVS